VAIAVSGEWFSRPLGASTASYLYRMKARLISLLCFGLTALVLVGCGGGAASASGDLWSATNAEIRHLIAEVKPREVEPGCSPSREEVDLLKEVIEDRARGERPSGPALEESFRAAEGGGFLRLTREQEQIACSRKEADQLNAEVEQKQLAQEASEGATPGPLPCESSGEITYGPCGMPTVEGVGHHIHRP
jgi:hypothetical protein